MNLSFVSNYNDCDPISLENIASLAANRAFFLSTYGRLCAYDACAWIQHFALKRPITHPCTGAAVENEDVWECYFVAKEAQAQAPNDDVQRALDVFESTRLIASVCSDARGPKQIRLAPESPLFNVKILKLSSVGERNLQTQVKRIEFLLVDTRDRTRVIGNRRIANVSHPHYAVVALAGSTHNNLYLSSPGPAHLNP